MKKIILILCLLIIGCSNNIQPESVLTGYIHIIGNEPFTEMVFASNNFNYKLATTKENLKILNENQCSLIKIYYDLIKNNIIYFSKFEIMD